MTSIIVAVSGGFDPLHIGHIRNFKEAKNLLGNYLVIILHSDNWLINKKGFVFMPYEERKEIIESIKYVDKVVKAVSDNKTCEDSLEYYRPNKFAKGGDRTPNNMEKSEIEMCKKLNIEIVYNVGGKKIQSSSWLTNKFKEYKNGEGCLD